MVAAPPYGVSAWVDYASPGALGWFQREVNAVLAGSRDPVQITSYYRTPQENARSGGAYGSQHTTGTAADVQAPTVEGNLRLRNAFRARGLQAWEFRSKQTGQSYTHVQLWPASTTLRSGLYRAIYG